MTKNTSSRRARRGSTKTSNTQRAAVTGITGAVLVLIVLIAQFVGIDVLNTSTGNSTPVPATSGSTVSSATTSPPSGKLIPIPGGYDGGWFQVYFTQPINTQDPSKFHGAPIEDALVRAIDGAQQSLDVAVFEMNSQPVTDALFRACLRGVMVRVVSVGEYGLEDPETTLDQIEAAGIPLKTDGTRNGLMHNKFFVIDGLYVWTGSTNITVNGMYNNNNNSMLIRSSRLADDYATEFNELFAGSFGKSSPQNTPNPVVTVEGTQIEVIFEAEGDAPARLAELLGQAHTVRFLAFSFTDSMRWNDNGTERSVMELLRDRARSGAVDLQGVVESSSRSYVKPLYCAGLDVRQDGNPDVMHDKVFIIDESIVVMGSFNFSQSAANDNDENMLIIHNPDLARAYLEEFSRRWAEAQAMPSSAFSC